MVFALAMLVLAFTLAEAKADFFGLVERFPAMLRSVLWGPGSGKASTCALTWPAVWIELLPGSHHPETETTAWSPRCVVR